MHYYQIYIGGVRNNNQFFLEHQEKFYYSTFFPYLEEHQIKTVWILGDFFENRKIISVQILNKALSFLEKFEQMGIQVYLLIGNHDTVFKNTNTLTSLVPMTRSFSNMTLIKKVQEIDFEGVKVGFISWISPDVQEECLHWIRTTDASIICGHFEINSFEIVKGVRCKNGLDTQLFDRFDQVFSGHFHIRATNGLIQYLGNPYQTHWGESEYEKGFHIFDTQTRSLEFIKNPINIYTTIQYDDHLSLSDFDDSSYQNKIVRIKNSGQNKQKFEMLVDRISSVCYSLEIVEDKTIMVSPDENPLTTDTSQLIKNFIDSCQIKHLDKNQLQTLIFDIYKEAQEKMDLSC